MNFNILPSYSEIMDKNENCNISWKDKQTCDRCGNNMEKLTSCHLKCMKCGSEIDCSD